MDTRTPIDRQATALMILLCAIWGLQQVAIKSTSVDIAPIMQIAIRSGLAAAMVGVLVLFRFDEVKRHFGSWRAGMVVGVLFASEFVAVSEGLRFTSAAHMVIFLYTAPIFAAIGLHWRFPSERLTPLQWAGIFVAFSGVVLAFYAPSAAGASVNDQRLGDALGLLGAMFWGATTLAVRCTRLAETPASLTLFYQLLGAFIILLCVAFLSRQTTLHFTPMAIASLTFQTLAVSFFSFLTWFWLLGRYLGSRLGVLSFLTPLFGVALGVWLLDETLEVSFILGSALVLTGIVMVSGHDVLRQVMSKRASTKE